MAAIEQKNVLTSGGWLAGALVTATGRSTARSLGARFAESFNVLDYGAKPNDPAFDNRASIQAALDAAFAADSVGDRRTKPRPLAPPVPPQLRRPHHRSISRSRTAPRTACWFRPT